MATNAQPAATGGSPGATDPSQAEAEYYRVALLAPPAGLFLLGLASSTWARVMAIPLSFLVVCALALLVVALLTEVPAQWHTAVLGGLVFFAPWVLGLGYAFVLVVLLGWGLFGRFRSPGASDPGP